MHFAESVNVLQNQYFWYMAPYVLVNSYRLFVGACCLRL